MNLQQELVRKAYYSQELKHQICKDHLENRLSFQFMYCITNLKLYGVCKIKYSLHLIDKIKSQTHLTTTHFLPKQILILRPIFILQNACFQHKKSSNPCRNKHCMYI